MTKTGLTFLSAILLFAACATTKKTAKVEDVTIATTQADTMATTGVSTHVVDTSWWDAGTFTHTIITFEDEPAEPDTIASHAPRDSVMRPATTITIAGTEIKTTTPVRIRRVETTTMSRQSSGQHRVCKKDSTTHVEAKQAVTNVATHKYEKKQAETKPATIFHTWMIYAGIAAIAIVIIEILHRRATGRSIFARFWDFLKNLF